MALPVVSVAPGEQWRALRRTTGRARRALVSAWVGFYVDMVDIYLPVVALAPAIAYFQPGTLSSAEASLLFYTTFAATLMGRPLGAVLFGHFADTLGRRRLTLVSIAGFSACTTAIGLLPGYAAWGAAAPLTLVLLRFVDGVFLGGEYTSATPLAFEHCPPCARGLFGGVLMGAYALAYATISAGVLLLLAVMPAAAYETYGWRVPFLLGGVLGFVFLGYRARVPESDLWRSTPKEPRPLGTLVTRFRRDLAQVLLLMTGLWLVATSVVTVMPRLLTTELGRSDTWTTAVLLVSQLCVFCAFVGTGAASQLWGRRRTLVAGAVASVTVGMAAYVLVLSTGAGSWTLAWLVVATQVVVLAVWGTVTSYCTERFRTAVRCSGFGIAYSVAVLPASFYAVYMAALADVMPYRYTQLVLLGVGALLTVVGALLGPETADLDLGQPDPEPEPVRGALKSPA
ncbi:MAG TPA: MFS transporter [Marmoricola sp.]|nr:MFS transporter [Marmoricola sp.]